LLFVKTWDYEQNGWYHHKGSFQQLSAAEADHFVQKLQNIMMEWDGRCIGESKSAGAV